MLPVSSKREAAKKEITLCKAAWNAVGTVLSFLCDKHYTEVYCHLCVHVNIFL